jgi:hypothetical protein
MPLTLPPPPPTPRSPPPSLPIPTSLFHPPTAVHTDSTPQVALTSTKEYQQILQRDVIRGHRRISLNAYNNNNLCRTEGVASVFFFLHPMLRLTLE